MDSRLLACEVCLTPHRAPLRRDWLTDYFVTSSSKVKVQAPPGYVQPPTGKVSLHSVPSCRPASSSAFVVQLAARSSSSSSVTKPTAASHVDLDELRQQKAWELATSPAKAVPMQAFMMYMSGTGIQIFSIMSVWFLLKQAVTGAMGVQQGQSTLLTLAGKRRD